MKTSRKREGKLKTVTNRTQNRWRNYKQLNFHGHQDKKLPPQMNKQQTKIKNQSNGKTAKSAIMVES